MNQNECRTELLQWHPAFYAGLQVEFGEESQMLTFENEHHLGTKPKLILHYPLYAGTIPAS